MSEPELLVRIEGGMGRLTLNRPAALHALTENMVQLMTDALLAWRDDAAIKAVLLDHSGPRGFCAGGDIRVLAESGAGDGKAARSFFFTEYRLNDLMVGYPKPIIAVIDGVTMGGGVGISLPARYRIATERTTFAMPETGIGLFPDVGGGWHLSRLPGRSGLWLALTGSRLKGADCLALGIATHFVESGRIEALKAELIAGAGDIDAILAAYASDPGPSPLAAHRADIDRLFSGDSLEAILDALNDDGSEWACTQLTTMATKSPQTLKVSLRQLTLGAAMKRFSDVMRMEYRIASRVLRRHDFLEGVRAVIVDKDNAPKWDPPTIRDVTDAMLDEIFAPLPADQEWSPLPQTLEIAE
jgi:enoyl-CoA hydratase